MKTFLQPLQGLAEIEEIEKQAKKNHGILEVSGCIESQKAHLMYGLSGLFPSHLVIAADEKTAKDLYEDYRFYDKRVYYYPAKDLLFFQADIHGNLLIRQRMQHSLFRDKIRDFSFADIDDPGKQQQVVTDLLNFLAKWLYGHILSSDIMIGKLPAADDWMLRDNPCEFTDDYLTGIEIVDLEHQQLFCIVERAYQLVKSNDVITCYDELLSIIHELTEYTVTHFADEEAYMEKIGYEGLAAQKNAHASFVARLESINLIELDENPQKYMESLIEFLLGWLINHILYSDKKIPVQA